MKRFPAIAIIALAITLISWGHKAHKIIALIAENHLTQNTKQLVSGFLNNQRMADVSSWADEVKSEPQYKHTAPWHFVELPSGLSYNQFRGAIKSQHQPNVYSAIMECEKQLADKTTTSDKKQEALKFLIHLIGDAHQPMHVSRAEDRNGNDIHVKYSGEETNLHALWDSRLIDHEVGSDGQTSRAYDTASPAQVAKWQNDDPMIWLWESYQISERLYAEAAANNNPGQDYYQSHIGIIHQRVEQAGIRLAGVLNHIFNGAKITVQPPITTNVKHAALQDLSSLVGTEVITSGKVYGHKSMGSFILVDIGGPYPNQLLTIVLRGGAKTAYLNLDGKTVTVQGTLVNRKGKPEIVITDAGKITAR